jgi:hypothetical protein
MPRIYRAARRHARFVAKRGDMSPATRSGYPLRGSLAVMTQKQLLVGSSLLSVLLLSFHLTQDALYARAGTHEAGAGNLTAIVMLLVMLTGPTLIADKMLGRIIMVILALFAVGMPVLHFNLGSDWNKRSGALFFVWCLIALGINGLFSLLLVVETRRRRGERAVAP